MGKQFKEPCTDGQPLLSDELAELGYLRASRQKFDIEFSRYKQDCRKRALDLAATMIQHEWLTWEKKKETDQPTIISVADKYYQWLINLPQ